MFHGEPAHVRAGPARSGRAEFAERALSQSRFGTFRPRAGVPNRRVCKYALAFALAAGLSGCAGGAPTDSFDLSASTTGAAARAPKGQLVVAEPLATSPTDSDRIVVRPTPDTVATLKGAQWVERLPRLVQTRIVQSFENARLLRSVGRPDSKIEADYTLSPEIRRFDIDIASAEAVVEISIKLVREKNGRILAARIFATRAPASANSGASAAAALDQALGEALAQIVAWTAARL